MSQILCLPRCRAACASLAKQPTLALNLQVPWLAPRGGNRETIIRMSAPQRHPSHPLALVDGWRKMAGQPTLAPNKKICRVLLFPGQAPRGKTPRRECRPRLVSVKPPFASASTSEKKNGKTADARAQSAGTGEPGGDLIFGQGENLGRSGNLHFIQFGRQDGSAFLLSSPFPPLTPRPPLPPSFGRQGENLGRSGKLHFIQFGCQDGSVYLFDIFTLGMGAFNQVRAASVKLLNKEQPRST